MESLSEYLDGGLSDADVRKIEDHLQTCGSCSEELDSLRDTVGLLRQTPVIPTRRDFTFAEAPDSVPEPLEPVAAKGFPGFRVPVWAYGAAASVAVVAFAVTLSIDVTRGPDDGGETALVAEENGDSFATILDDPDVLPTGTPIPPRATPAPQEKPPGVTAMPAPPTSTLEPTPAPEMAMVEPTPAPTQTPQPAALSMGRADENDSEPDTAMSRAVEPTSGASTSAPPVGDVAERPADAPTYRPTAVPAPPMPTPQPTDTPTPKRTATPRPTATPTLTPWPTPTVTPHSTSPPAPQVAPDDDMERRGARESTDITTEQTTRMRESLGTDRGVSVWWIVEGVLAALALGLVVVLALKLRTRRRRVS